VRFERATYQVVEESPPTSVGSRPMRRNRRGGALSCTWRSPPLAVRFEAVLRHALSDVVYVAGPAAFAKHHAIKAISGIFRSRKIA